MSLTIQGAGGLGPDRLYDYAWNGFTLSGDVGVPTTVPAHVKDLALQLTGTIAGSLSIALQGSNDNITFTAMKDTAGTLIALTDASIINISNMPKYIKPVATAGTAGSTANVTIHGTVGT